MLILGVKIKQNKAKKTLQAPRVGSVPDKQRLKVCPPQVAKVLNWANLAGDEALPPRLPLRDISGPGTRVSMAHGTTLADLIDAIGKLPDALRLHLMEVMSNPAEWREQPAEARKQFKQRFTNPKDADFYAKKLDFRLAAQLAAVYRRYKMALAARETLIAIVDDKRSVWPTTAFMTRGPDGKGKYAGDPIGDALLEAEIDYIKRCPICKVFFYAGRANIEAYPATCAKALREQQRRARIKEAAARNRKGKG